MLRRKIALAAGLLALAVPTVAHAEPGPGIDRFEETARGRLSSTIRPGAVDTAKRVTVMVEMVADPVAVVEAQTSGELSKARKASIREALKRSQNRLKGQIEARGGKVLSQMQSAYNGMRVNIARKQLAELAKLPGVKSIQPVQIHHLENAVSVPFLGVPQVWQNSGFLGEKVKVAVIDTGIDYTHADFNAPAGAVYTTEKAGAALAPNANYIGPKAPRIKGGVDLVGDDYDANVPAKAVPKPDFNPLDCQGHGTHVAGTVGGNGVKSDGTAYTGPYNATTHSTSFKVGPGVAPKADLYAVKVFGCTGSTDVVAEAIDWAVRYDMDVINMSLGSSYGRSSDPSAVAATNAVAAGVIVVASAGNSGPNPYLTGSPGVGRGVISVAAVDSTASFPGATVTIGGTPYSAINANGADLPAGPYEVVVVTDNPATPENESLGCSTAAFASAGVESAPDTPKQLAVVERGTCARVAKAIFGQQAGADAVLMINNAADYPPFEGAITSNPDDGTPFTVTIPFLGVRGTDGAAIRATDGESATLAEATLANPGFRGYASFSSGGPRNGDSGLKPTVSAPGVSIASAGVGTETGAEILSGTSMASPHVAGVAALTRQAHPKWTSQQVAAAMVSSADPNKVAGYRLTLGGGLVDTNQAVKTSVFALGDSHKTSAGTVWESTLSYGFHEPSGTFKGTRKVTLVNKGSKSVTFTLKNEATSQSRPATVSFSKTKVKVPGKSSRTVNVTLRVSATKVGTSLTQDGFGLREVSGNVRASSKAGTLRVPYLMVPRARALVSASQTPVTMAVSPNSEQPNTVSSGVNVKLTNKKGALAAIADFYTWGLTDGKDVGATTGSGFDLRAAGVQSFPAEDPDDQLLVFAVNNHSRWSNAATNEFDVEINTDADPDPEYVVFSFDSGAIRNGDTDGVTEVFLYDVGANTLSASGFLAQAPTDSSTILLPVLASDLGLTESDGTFEYGASSYSTEDPTGSDQFATRASYDPWNPSSVNGQYVAVGVNKTVTVPVEYDTSLPAGEQALGTMVVVVDNRSGKDEALLLNKPS